ncbi:MAG: AGE family epimerase/isomerase [Coprococcus sp.]
MMIGQIRDELTTGILPFWKKLRDDEYGGYYGLVDIDLNVDRKAEKGTILNSRILWFFSNAYLTLENDDDLKYAKHAYEYLVNHCIDREYGGVYWSTNYDGTMCDSTKHTYCQAFAIYGLSSYYAASKDEDALKHAFELFDIIESKCTDDRGYLEAFERNFVPASNEKLSENGVMAEKTMNTLLHVFEAYTELYRVSGNEKVRDKMLWILDIFKNDVFNEEKQRLEVFFDKNMNSLIDLHSYGHDIESAWLIDRGLEVLGEGYDFTEIKEITAKLEKCVYEKAYTDAGLVTECECGVQTKSRVWWVQNEAVIGFINGYQKDNTKKEYKEAAKNIWEFIKDKLIDKRPGGDWFWEVDENGVPNPDMNVVDPWKCPYHSGRMCFEIIRRNIDA